MPTWVWIVVAAMAVVAIIVLIVALAVGRRRRTERLKRRFGPEYERTVASTGKQATAEKELATRERQHDKLHIRSLSPSERDDVAQRWRSVQTAFVDDPYGTLAEADRLVTEVMRQRGYPVDDFEQRAADISVDHPTIVEDYRAAHAVQRSQGGGEVGTEQQRQAFVHYRALFDELLDVHTPNRHTGTAQEASA